MNKKEYQEFLEWKKFKEFKKGQTTSKPSKPKETSRDYTKEYNVVRYGNIILTAITLALVFTTFVWGLVSGMGGSSAYDINMADWRIIWIITIVFTSLSVCFNITLGVDSYLRPKQFKSKFKQTIIFGSIAAVLLIIANVLIGVSFIGGKDIFLLKNDGTLIAGLVIYFLFGIANGFSGFTKTVASIKPVTKVYTLKGKRKLIIAMLVLACLGLVWVFGTQLFLTTSWCDIAVLTGSFDSINMVFIVPLIVLIMKYFKKYKVTTPIVKTLVGLLWTLFGLFVVSFSWLQISCAIGLGQINTWIFTLLNALIFTISCTALIMIIVKSSLYIKNNQKQISK